MCVGVLGPISWPSLVRTIWLMGRCPILGINGEYCPHPCNKWAKSAALFNLKMLRIVFFINIIIINVIDIDYCYLLLLSMLLILVNFIYYYYY